MFDVRYQEYRDGFFDELFHLGLSASRMKRRLVDQTKNCLYIDRFFWSGWRGRERVCYFHLNLSTRLLVSSYLDVSSSYRDAGNSQQTQTDARAQSLRLE